MYENQPECQDAFASTQKANLLRKKWLSEMIDDVSPSFSSPVCQSESRVSSDSKRGYRRARVIASAQTYHCEGTGEMLFFPQAILSCKFSRGSTVNVCSALMMWVHAWERSSVTSDVFFFFLRSLKKERSHTRTGTHTHTHSLRPVSTPVHFLS